ncbi:sodium:alanine symporter family protein [Aeromicrobium ponti]|uniref:AGCS family alanine or glycine:cation symporter n=1 Tax=Cytobacillus oceanisediminis TaxID=665099 RepID=A0A562JLF2_9BACI|nr:sodium:alanine symporter family protein [Cytobacillus oceanisediminis]TWH84049.1 AGCS family alanine or glycine:cation symporter [Cytobacillus oceanisediminis]
MDSFMNFVARVSEFTTVPLMILLVGGGIFLTIKLGFFQFKYFPHIMKLTFGSMFKKGDGEGTVTPFQAVSSALASTVGAANIIGVPVAIALGGPGAVFWMWMVAIIGMATKYSEVVLGLKYRTTNKKGEYIGGPMYYIDRGLGWKKTAIMFAVIQLLVVFASTSVQSNSLAGAFSGSFQIPPIVTGIVVSALIVLVMFGGLTSIGKFAEKVVPSMVVLYLAASLIVIILHIDAVPNAFYMIFKYAFTPISAAGGFAGAAVAAAIRWGIARGVYSNEAGMGSAAIFHAGAKIKHPASQGFWGVFEVFVDTIVVCTITAVVILSTDVWQTVEASAAAGMTAQAMASVFGSGPAGLIITVAVFIFAFTTILMVVYAGEKQAEYLFGYKASIVSRYIFIGAVLFGSVGSLLLVWSLLDIMLALIVVPNMTALLFLSGKVKDITVDYFTNYYKKDPSPDPEVLERKIN